MNNHKLKIKEIRKMKNLSGFDISQKIGISQSYFSDLENQKYDIKLSLLLDIGRALGVCPYKLSNICIYCPMAKSGALFFKHCACITVCSKPRDLYNDSWGDDMNEKTTVYIEPKLKEDVQVKLLRDGDKKSLSGLVNEVLQKWLKEQK